MFVLVALKREVVKVIKTEVAVAVVQILVKVVEAVYEDVVAVGNHFVLVKSQHAEKHFRESFKGKD